MSQSTAISTPHSQISQYITVCAHCNHLKITENRWIEFPNSVICHFHQRCRISHGICPECSDKLLDDLKND